jgi:hypothetical protein
MSAPCRVRDDGLLLHVRLTPKGGRDAIDGVETGADGKAYLKARVSAVAEDGKANAALIALIAKTAGLSKSAISIISGDTSRQKTLVLAGAGEDAASRLGMHL